LQTLPAELQARREGSTIRLRLWGRGPGLRQCPPAIYGATMKRTLPAKAPAPSPAPAPNTGPANPGQNTAPAQPNTPGPVPAVPLRIDKEKIRQWQNGAEGFFAWIADIQPRILTARGRYEPIQLAEFQREAIRGALARKPDGSWRFTTIAISWPRRHSKTIICGLLVLWRFTLFPHENIIILSNSERQSLSTSFKIVRSIITNTPALLAQIGGQNILKDAILYPALQSSITAKTCSPSSLYGEKVTCGWVSEIHASFSDEPMQIISSSLGDSLGSWLLIDSTTDTVGGVIHNLETLQASGEDPTVYVAKIQYRDLAEALEKSPPWIRRDWLKSRAAQLLPATFQTQHLNQRSSSDNCLFAREDIARAQERLPCPFTADDLKTLAAGRSYVCGGGLDRAYFGSLHGDSTVWTVTAKIAPLPGAEPDFYVLNQKAILGSLGVLTKKAISEDYKNFGLENVVFESYNSQDLYTWSLETSIPSELVHATATAQVPAFTELYRIVKEGRLHFSDRLQDLAREMETFTYELRNNSPRFGNDKNHDDHIYSLCWSIYATRQKELAAYTLDSVICQSKSRHAPLCFLRGGDLILNCGPSCPSFLKVQQMHLQHRRTTVESEISLPDFFKSLVKHEGLTSYQGV
jgi:hypothetical protein